MPPLRIALLQLQAAGNQPANLRRGLAGCQDARALGADIALFPEDLVITCINGGFNNLSAWEAAQLVSVVKPKATNSRMAPRSYSLPPRTLMTRYRWCFLLLPLVAGLVVVGQEPFQVTSTVDAPTIAGRPVQLDASHKLLPWPMPEDAGYSYNSH